MSGGVRLVATFLHDPKYATVQYGGVARVHFWGCNIFGVYIGVPIYGNHISIGLRQVASWRILSTKIMKLDYHWSHRLNKLLKRGLYRGL